MNSSINITDTSNALNKLYFTSLSKKEEVILQEKPSLFDALGYGEPRRFVNKRFGQTLYENQKDIVYSITDPTVRRLITVEPRQSGKTTASGVSYHILLETEGMAWNVKHAEPYKIGVFRPKSSQAELFLSRMATWSSRNPRGMQMYNWDRCRNDRLVHVNGSEIHAISASEQASNEGMSFNVIHLTEAQDISDYAVSNIILPMGGATNTQK